MNLKPRREIAIPHADVLKGTFLQSEFAADISAVHSGTAPTEYSADKDYLGVENFEEVAACGGQSAPFTRSRIVRHSSGVSSTSRADDPL